MIDDLRALKEKKYPNLSWTVDPKLGTTELLEQVKDKKLAYTIADSVAISLFQRVHPEIAVALDVTDEQPVTGLPSWTTIKPSLRPCSISLIPSMKTAPPARLEEKYLGHGDDFDYVDTRTFLRAVDSVLPGLQPLFEKYAQEIDWKLLAAISYRGIALGCSGHLPPRACAG